MNELPTEEFEILPSGEMQKKYGMYAENRPLIVLDPRNVPERLRHLIPLAEKFGVSCDITRHDLGYKTSDAEKLALSAALEGWHDEIADWVNSWEELTTSTEEMYVFMKLCVFEAEECGGPGLRGKYEK